MNFNKIITKIEIFLQMSLSFLVLFFLNLAILTHGETVLGASWLGAFAVCALYMIIVPIFVYVYGKPILTKKFDETERLKNIEKINFFKNHQFNWH